MAEPATIPTTPWENLSSSGAGGGRGGGPGAPGGGGGPGGLGELGRPRARQVQADVDQVHSAGAAAPGADDEAGLDRPEGDGVLSREGGPLDGAGVGIDAAGQVDGHHQPRTARGPIDQRGRGRPQPAGPPDADDAVEHEVGAVEALAV